MKCIKMPAKDFGTVTDATEMVVRRVTDDDAFIAVHYGPWEYTTRKEWKAAGRKYGWGLI